MLVARSWRALSALGISASPFSSEKPWRMCSSEVIWDSKTEKDLSPKLFSRLTCSFKSRGVVPDLVNVLCQSLFVLFIYLSGHPPTQISVGSELPHTFLKKELIFIFRERVRGGEKNQYVVASCVPFHWGPGPQPRHVSWLGIKPATLWLACLRSIHWATLALWTTYF